VNPMQYLSRPKCWPAFSSCHALLIFDLIGIYGGYLVGVELLGVELGRLYQLDGIQRGVKDVYAVFQGHQLRRDRSWSARIKGTIQR